jgi:hypothetical protein
MVAGNSHSTVGGHATMSCLGQSARNLPLLASVGPVKRASYLTKIFSFPSIIKFYIESFNSARWVQCTIVTYNAVTFPQLKLRSNVIGYTGRFVTPNMDCHLLFYGFSIEPGHEAQFSQEI